MSYYVQLSYWVPPGKVAVKFALQDLVRWEEDESRLCFNCISCRHAPEIATEV